MANRAIADEIADIPIEARREVMDFVLFLRQRYGKSVARRASRKTPIKSDPFLGMWSGRDEMGDSADWVREIRKHDWVRHAD